MAGFVKGEVVVLPFPFTDLSASKRRPALVVAILPGDDVILCMITSKNVRDTDAISIGAADFAQGGLPRPSNIRPNRLFTAHTSIILRSAGILTSARIHAVIQTLIKIIST